MVPEGRMRIFGFDGTKANFILSFFFFFGFVFLGVSEDFNEYERTKMKERIQNM